MADSGRKLVLRSKAHTNPNFGKKPDERGIEEYINYGVVNLDKPAGPTSHEVVAWVKAIFNIEKSGHSGTLDPRVTGVLPVALGESTKVVQAMQADKEYVGIIRFHEKQDKSRIIKTFKEFIGEILQRPPVKSAVKRRLRKRRIYYMDIIETKEKDVLFRVGCEAGTYIRKLCHDIGEVLGCGAHMVELRRTKSGSFTEETSVFLHDLKDAYVTWKESGDEALIRQAVQPVERVFDNLPKVFIRDSTVDALCHGADLAIPGLVKIDADVNVNDIVGIFTLKDELVAIGEARMDTKAMLVNDAGIAVRIRRVVMKPGIYPRMWVSKQYAGVA